MAEDDHLEVEVNVLLAELAAARDDDRSFQTIMTTIVSVVIALLVGLAAVKDEICPSGTTSGCIEVHPLLIALTPAVPLAMFAFLAMQGSAATIRAYYVRAVEHELRNRVHVPARQLGHARLPALSGVTLEAISLRRGRGAYRVVALIVYAAVVLVFGGLSVYMLSLLSPAWSVPAAAIYLAALVPLGVQTARTTVRGRAYFEDVLKSFTDHEPAVPDRSEDRSLAGYLLLPRPQDLIKWFVLPATFVFVEAVNGFPPGARWGRMVAVLVILEFLVYQARYQVNDLRGFVDDQAHPSHADRRRLPGPVSAVKTRAAQTLVVAGARILLAVVVVESFPSLDLRGPIYLSMGVVVLSTVPYEYLRGREERRDLDDTARAAGAPVLWAMIGIGYALRGGLGVDLTSRGEDVTPLVLLGACTLGMIGIVFVTLTWALEATSMASPGTATVTSADPPDPRTYDYAGHAHLIGLRRFFLVDRTYMDFDDHGLPEGAGRFQGALAPSAAAERHRTLRHWRAVREVSAWNAPWNLANVAACAAAGAFGASAAHAAIGFVVVAGVVGAAVGVALCVSPPNWRPGVVVSGSLALVALGRLLTTPATPLIAVPVAAAGLLYLLFVKSSWEELKSGAADLALACRGGARHAGQAMIASIVGSKTWELMDTGRVNQQSAEGSDDVQARRP